jgi:hypothetical protein
MGAPEVDGGHYIPVPVNAGCPLFAPAVAYPINTQLGLRGADTSNSSREGVGVGNAGDPAYTLQAGPSHAVAYDHPGRYNNIHGGTGEHRHVMPTLESTNPKQIIAFSSNMSVPDHQTDGTTPTLKLGGHGGGNPPAVAYSIMPMNSGNSDMPDMMIETR